MYCVAFHILTSDLQRTGVKIVVTGTFREQLVASAGEAELWDEAGNLIGRFVPTIAPDLKPTPEELARRLAPNCKTYSSAEVLSHVKGLTS